MRPEFRQRTLARSAGKTVQRVDSSARQEGECRRKLLYFNEIDARYGLAEAGNARMHPIIQGHRNNYCF
jgi:hypothetical protein